MALAWAMIASATYYTIAYGIWESLVINLGHKNGVDKQFEIAAEIFNSLFFFAAFGFCFF